MVGNGPPGMMAAAKRNNKGWWRGSKQPSWAQRNGWPATETREISVRNAVKACGTDMTVSGVGGARTPEKNK
jgi:hypothetical protein